jgi:hypothetical protein
MSDPSPQVSVDHPPRTDLVPEQVAPPAGRYQHAFWFALLLATAVTLAGTSFAVGAYVADAMPDTVVRAYFAALQRGDAPGALGYGPVLDDQLGDGTAPAVQHQLLTPAVLAKQNSLAPIQDLVVRKVERSGDTANVDITYLIDLPSGRQFVSDTVPVVRHGHGWRLAASVVVEVVDPGGGSALADIIGTKVPRGQFDLFPGAVPVSYDTPNLELSARDRVVRFADSGDLQVDAAVSPAGRRAIAPAVDAAMAACLAGRSTVQTLCPVPDIGSSVPGSLRGRLVRSVSTTMTLRIDSPDGRIHIGGAAAVDATYQGLDDNNIATTEHTVTVPLAAYCYPTAPGTVRWNAS